MVTMYALSLSLTQHTHTRTHSPTYMLFCVFFVYFDRLHGKRIVVERAHVQFIYYPCIIIIIIIIFKVFILFQVPMWMRQLTIRATTATTVKKKKRRDKLINCISK